MSDSSLATSVLPPVRRGSLRVFRLQGGMGRIPFLWFPCLARRGVDALPTPPPTLDSTYHSAAHVLGNSWLRIAMEWVTGRSGEAECTPVNVREF